MKVTFILADTVSTYLALVHENEHKPYRKRTATIELTPEQVAAIGIRETGFVSGVEKHEEILECFVENEGGP